MKEKKINPDLKTPILIQVELTEDVLNQIAAKTALLIESKTSKDTTSPKDVFLTVKEASVISQKSPNTIARHIRLGLIKSAKSGKSWLISKENFDKYVNNLQ